MKQETIQRPKLFILQIMVVSFFIGACTIPFFPVRFITIKRLENVSPLAKLTEVQAEAIQRLWLTYNYWEFTVLSADINKDNFSQILSIEARRLEINLTPEKLNQVQDKVGATRVASFLMKELEDKQSLSASAYFELQFYGAECRNALFAARNLLEAAQRKNAKQAAIRYLRQAVQIAQRFDAEGVITAKGEMLLQDLAKPTANLEQLVEQIDAWVDSAFYLTQGQPEPTPTPESIGPVGTDITISLPPGDVQRGEELLAEQACHGCHGKGRVGPAFRAIDSPDGKGIGLRAQEEWKKTEYTGNATSAQEYLIESTVIPNIYVVAGYLEGVHPRNYSETLSTLDMANLLAYMLAQQ